MRWLAALLMLACALPQPLRAAEPEPQSAAAPPPRSASGWLLAPYLWAPSLKGRVGIAGSEVSTNVSARELAGGLDAAAMGYLRWTRGPQFLYAEALGVRFHDRRFEPLFNQDVEAEIALFEAGYGRHFQVGLLQLSPYAGLRYASIEAAIRNPQQALSADERWLDPALGLIAEAPLYRRLSGLLKLDAAGLGLGRDHYWNGIAALRYPLGRSFSIGLGYRWVRFNAEPGGDNELKLRLRGDGPEMGVTYSF
jgi:hypothetical protein